MSKRKRIAELERRVKELEEREAIRAIPVYVPYYVPTFAQPAIPNPGHPYPFDQPFYVTCEGTATVGCDTFNGFGGVSTTSVMKS